MTSTTNTPPPLPFSGKIYCKVEGVKDTILSWCYTIIPTHSIIVVPEWPSFPQRVAVHLTVCESEEEASEKAKVAKELHEYGKIFVYRSGSYFWAVSVHYQTCEADSKVYMCFNEVRNAKEIKVLEMTYKQKESI